ncbi:hypothetical protein E1A91_D07G016100v1 [Gossypium mustelinum]|uniref:G protein gamma domain-containing protein n=1 Tax=Gossypium mustelinum TaxID=34275 RepID=A0A5D2U591_GOSMU|nr:hypothetical protein E1A91_D07G016100v1 [Gossypium mustelinum]
MAAGSGGSLSLPPPCPKSPPEYPDLYGKRRETAKVQMLEREISFLEVELKSVEGLQHASSCCKEVTDFVTTNSDPLIPTNRKNRKSCRLWKWLCGIPCFNLSMICCCCYSKCSCHLTCRPCYSCIDMCDCSLCKCSSCNCSSCLSCCTNPRWRCCSCPKSQCCGNISCGKNCCIFRFPSCMDRCCRWKCCPKCPKVRLCCCTKNCCNPCCFLF